MFQILRGVQFVLGFKKWYNSDCCTNTLVVCVLGLASHSHLLAEVTLKIQTRKIKLKHL